MGPDEESGRRIMEDLHGIPACEYRRIVPSEPGEDPFVVCGCSGGLPIGLVNGSRGDIPAVCGSCTIPSELDSSRRPCLFLVPVRIWRGDALQSGFSCRWFASLKPKYLPSEVWKCCFGCPHWFPRPPGEDSVPGIDRWIRKVIRMYLEPIPEQVRSKEPKGRLHPPVFLRDRITERIRKLRVSLAGRV